jgi:hypothetical protein
VGVTQCYVGPTILLSGSHSFYKYRCDFLLLHCLFFYATKTFVYILRYRLIALLPFGLYFQIINSQNIIELFIHY